MIFLIIFICQRGSLQRLFLRLIFICDLGLSFPGKAVVQLVVGFSIIVDKKQIAKGSLLRPIISERVVDPHLLPVTH